MAESNNYLLDASEDELSSSNSSVELVVDNTKGEEKAEAATENNIYDFDLDTMKDKPWLKPGADLTDYFNYGFTEKTWKKYCEMQRANRDFVERENKSERAFKDSRYDDRVDDRHYKRRRGEDDWHSRRKY